VLTVLVLVAACAPKPPPPAPPPAPLPAKIRPEPKAAVERPPVVAFLVPLSGPHAAVGRDMLDAAQMALFTVADKRTVLLPRDTRGTPEGAVAAFRSALAEGAAIVLGPLFAASARAVAPLAREHGIPVLSFSNDAAVAETGVFVLGFRPEEQVARVLDYAIGQGLRRIALLASEDAYGQRALAAWRATLARHGMSDAGLHALAPAAQPELDAAVRRLSAYDARRAALEQQKSALRARDDEVARAALAQLATQDTFGPPPFDALLIAEGGLRLRSIAALAAYYDITPPTVRFLGTARWLEEDPQLANVDVLRGSWLATRDPEGDAAFRRRFAELFGREPAPLAVLAHDAAALAFVLARDDQRFSRGALTTPEGFSGYSGIIRLRPDGLAEHGLAVVELGPEGVRVVDPAPKQFPSGFAAAAPVQTLSAVSSQNRRIASATR
jgi:hypothetical protein